MSDNLFTPDELEVGLLGSKLNKPILEQLKEQHEDNLEIIMFNAKTNKWIKVYDRDTSNNR